jgi:hypothetical protein
MRPREKARDVTRCGRRRGLRAQHLLQVLEAAADQLLLVGEVRVEGRPPDVRPVAHVLHAEAVPASLGDERDEGIAEGTAGALDPPVAGVGELSTHLTPPDPGRVAAVRPVPARWRGAVDGTPAAVGVSGHHVQ